MGDRDRKYRRIYDLWRSGLSYRQITRRPIEDAIALKTVRNLIYRFRRDPALLESATPRQQCIWEIYLEGVEQLHLPSAKAIRRAWDLQPPVRVSERTIRDAVATLHYRPGRRRKPHPETEAYYADPQVRKDLRQAHEELSRGEGTELRPGETLDSLLLRTQDTTK